MTKSRKILCGLAASAAILGGCASSPYYDDPYYDRTTYYEYPAYGYYGYAPGYYVAPPAVSFGLTYSNRDYYWRRRHG